MAEIPSNIQVLESVVKYQALGKLAELSEQISDKRRLNSEETLELRKRATIIRLWLKALDHSDYLTKEQRDKIKYALVDLADVNDFATAPVLNQTTRPSILIGGTTTITNNNTYSGGTPVENLSIDTGTSDVFTLATSLGNGVVFHYVVTDGTNYRSGQVTAVWNNSTAECADISSPEIGDTDNVVLDVDVNAGSFRLRATAASDNWQVFGDYFIID